MAATNPFRVSDLIAKYGWKVMPFLSNLGPQLLAEAQVLFVDSGHTNALDADDTEHGHSFEKPLATWDYAIGLCTAGERSVILLAPGHNDPLGDAQIDIDVSDITTIGIGDGGNRPTVDFDHANSSVNIKANNVTIKNVNLLPSTPDVLIGLHVETDVTGLHLKDVKFFIGEDGAGADEFIKAVELTSGNHDTVFEDVTILAHASALSATHGIHIAAASNRLTFRNVIIDGPYATGGIVETATGLNHIVEDCAVDVSGTNYSFEASSTFAKRTNNVDGQVTEDESESLLLTTRGTGVTPTGITDESILAYILGKGGTASASTYDNTAHSLEAIGDLVAGVASPTDVTDAVAATPTASSVQDMLQKDANQTYLRASHSLEAIGDALAAAENEITDLLPVTPTAISLQDALQKDANSTYDRASHSLEAIGDAVAAITSGVSSAVSATPTVRSLQDILEKDALSGFDDATDSLQAISDKAGAFDMTGSGQAGSVKASLDLAHTDLDAILADTLSISGGSLPADPTSDSLAAFIASGGTALGQELPDSMSLIDIIGNYTGAYDDIQADDNIKAHLDLIKTAVDATLVDTGTTIPGTITTAQTDITAILLDTGTTIPGTITTMQTDVTAILLDTGTTIPGTITTMQTDLTTITGTGGANLETATQTQVDDILADTITISGGAMVAAPTSGSLGSFIGGGGTALGTRLADSVSIIDAIGHTGGAFLTTGVGYWQEKTVTKTAGVGDDNLYDVAGGRILIKSFWGEVTTVVEGIQIVTKIWLDGTDVVNDRDLSTAVELNATADGSIIVFSAANPAVLTPLAPGATGAGNPMNPWVCAPGTIESVSADGTATGVIEWFLTYIPLETGVTVVASA